MSSNINRNNFRRYAIETSWTITSTAFLALAGLILNILLGNWLGEEKFGIYTLAATIFMLATTVAVFGLPIALTKYTAEYVDREDIGAQFFSASLLITLIITILGALLLFILRYQFSVLFNASDLVELLPILALGMPFYGLNKITIGRLNGIRQMGRMSIAEIIRYLLMIGFTSGAILWLRGGMIGAIWALTLSEILLFPVLWIFTGLHRNLCWDNLMERCQTLMKVGGKVVLARIVADLDARLGILLIGIFLSKSEVGIYALAALMAESIGLLPLALEKVTGPVMAEFFAKKQLVALENIINHTLRVTVFLLSITGLGLVIFFPEVVHMLYPDRPGFLLAETALGILIIGSIFQGIMTSVGPVFVSVNRPEVLFKINLERLFFNTLATVLMVNILGIEGAAIGKAVTIFFIFIIRTRVMETVASVKVNYKPLLFIPLLATVSILIVHLGPQRAVSTWIFRLALWGLYALLVTRFWRFDQYLIRLYRLVIPS